MLTYILESSVCLVVFLCFYKLLLEKENIHTFKRFYLLTSIVLSFGIPLLTFTRYVETSIKKVSKILENIPLQTNTQFETNATDDSYIQIILWSIYGLGVLVSCTFFFKSLIQIFFNIKKNSKLKNNHFVIVLLQDFVFPHTFFNYIFLNKHKFETQQIPEEVILHEKEHVLQKHSWDVLCVELLQVVFWFNPLIYILKRDIKLNHEFLADKAVLSKGIDISTYQNMLLEFSSNTRQPQLANAINYYSFTKKRFMIMSKHTSKKIVWLRSVFLLPILAFLLFSFSTETIVIEKELNTLEIQSKLLQENTATQKQIVEYNKLAKKYNAISRDKRIFKPNDLSRMEYLYSLMSKEQKNITEPFPLFPLQHTLSPNIDVDLGVDPDIDIDSDVDIDVNVNVPNVNEETPKVSISNNITNALISELVNKNVLFDYKGKEISREKAMSLSESTDFVVKRVANNPKKIIVLFFENKLTPAQIKKQLKKY